MKLKSLQAYGSERLSHYFLVCLSLYCLYKLTEYIHSNVGLHKRRVMFSLKIILKQFKKCNETITKFNVCMQIILHTKRYNIK